MLKIKDKVDSLQKLRDMGLNFFEEAVFSTSDLEGIQKFVEKNKAEEYCLRSVGTVLGKFFFAKNFEEIKKRLKSFKGQFLLGVSWNPFNKDHLVLLGDIQIKKQENWVNLTARDDAEADHRNIYDAPKFNISASLDDDRLWRVPGFSKLCRYITEHNLFDMIVEFVVYDIPLGNKGDEVVIAELRTDY